MCIVSAEAKLSKTRILSMKLDNGLHYLAYSNSIINLSGKKNSMILAVPGVIKKFHDTTKYNNFLEDIEKQASISLNRSKTKGFLNIGFETLNLGMYKVAYGKHLIEIAREFSLEISPSLVRFMVEHYDGWTFVVCAFDAKETMDSQPIAFEYEPFFADVLYFPTMDAHTGGAPKLDEVVKMDHSLMYGVSGLNCRGVNFTQEVPEFLKRRSYVSTKWDKELPNGDMYIKIKDTEVEKTNFEAIYNLFTRQQILTI